MRITCGQYENTCGQRYISHTRSAICCTHFSRESHTTEASKMKIVCLVLGLVAAASAANIVELAESLGANTLVALVKDAGLASTLADGGKRLLLYLYLGLLQLCFNGCTLYACFSFLCSAYHI